MNRLSKLLLAGNLVLLALLIALCIKEGYPRRILSALNAPEHVSSSEKKISYWFNRDKLFEAFPEDSSAIVFIGTSLTQNFELAELFHNASLKNRGIMGDVTQGVLQRLKPVTNGHPKKIIIELGINDVLMQVPEDTLLKNYERIMRDFGINSPRSKVYVQSVLPISATRLFPGVNALDVNDRIISVNTALKKMAKTYDATYIDLYSHFTIGKALNDDYTFDGLHLNGKGYLVWRDLLIPYVEE